VIPRNVNDSCALAAGAENFLDDVVVGLWPVNASPKLPYVDEIPDDVEFFEFVFAEELEQGIGLAPFRTEMNIGDPTGAEALHGDSLAPRPGERQTSGLLRALNSPDCDNFATQIPLASALVKDMTSHAWDYVLGYDLGRRKVHSVRRKTVTQILRAAYRKHVRDRATKLAIKRCLR
jgi:hypothetical protein